MQNKLSIKSAFAAVLCVSLAVLLADKSLYSNILYGSVWNLPFGKPTSIWTALSYNYQIDEPSSQPSVNAEIQWFQKHQDYITELTHNAQPYIYYVYQQLQKRHMPAELALLPMVESSYVPFVKSHVGATGLWQMMPETASGLGVKGADGRRNVIASTNAALNYLSYLHRTFGSWSLALAAYNAGEGTVENAIQENIKHHLPTNFWSLHLPKETEAYVPKLLALAAIVQNPERYNVHLEPVANKAYFGAIQVDNGKIDLEDVAKLSNSDPNTLHKLNPGISSESTPLPKKAQYVLVPIDKLPVLQANLKVAQLAPAPVPSAVSDAASSTPTKVSSSSTAKMVAQPAPLQSAKISAVISRENAKKYAKPVKIASLSDLKKKTHAVAHHNVHKAPKAKSQDSKVHHTSPKSSLAHRVSAKKHNQK